MRHGQSLPGLGLPRHHSLARLRICRGPDYIVWEVPDWWVRASFRESMRRLLRSLGYTVEAFPSAADLLASPRLVETACLITDVHMPAMTGIQLYSQLIDTGHPIPTILVTAYPDDVVRTRALKDGVVCYLQKPVDQKHLLRCIRAALASGEPPKENS